MSEEHENQHARFIPDGLLLRSAQGALLKVYNPRWWRLDRHVFWLLKRLLGTGKSGHAHFTALVTDSDGSRVETFKLPVYEIAEKVVGGG